MSNEKQIDAERHHVLCQSAQGGVMRPRAEFIIGGRRYRWNGWAGCQLESWEWLRVPAGGSRVLDFGPHGSVRVTVFTTRREGLKVRTTWAIDRRGSLDEHNQAIHQLRDLLTKVVF